jgi:uncharacterized membrane protein
MATAVPYFFRHSFTAIALLLQTGFQLACHQRPERSFELFGGIVAVCSRCLGIYLGAAVGLLLRISRQLALQLMLSTVVVSGLDSAAEALGLHGNWTCLRFVLGFVLGTTAGMLVSSSTRYHETSRFSTL